MARNEEGEFELVLGNKELLSVLFITVVLLGVFFAMGYVVGRNSAPIDTARRPEPYVRTDAPSAMSGQREAPKSEQPTEAKPETVPTAETPSQQPPAPAPEKPKPIEVAPVGLVEPQAGQTYLQITAVAKAEAEILAELLMKKGFKAIVAPGPSDKVFRVLVGPTRDPADTVKTKSELEDGGFKPVFIRKY